MMLHGSLFFKKKQSWSKYQLFLTNFQNSSSCSNVAGSSVGWKAQKGDKNGKDVVFSHSLPPVTTVTTVSVISPVSIGIAIVSTPTAIIPGFSFSLGFGLSLGFGISRSLSKVVITVSPGVGVSVISTPTVSVVSKTISV